MQASKRSILNSPAVATLAVGMVLGGASRPCLSQTTSADGGMPSIPSRVIPAGSRRVSADADVQRTTFGHSNVASSQQSVESPAPCPPAKPQPSPPAAAPPTSYAPPSTPSYAPPAGPQYAPQYAPGNVQYAPSYVPQYAPMVPQYAPPSYGPPPSAPPGNFFMPGPPSGGPPAYGPPMVPMVPVMAPSYAPALAPPMAGPPAPVAGGSVSVPTTRSSSRVVVRGPGLLGAGLARLGERLTQLGRTRIQTVQETVLENQTSQPLGGMTTISTQGLTPPPPSAAPPSAPPSYGPPQGAPPAEVPGPSPQGGYPQKHSFVHHLLGHD
jgi:hypothetical protein